MNIISAAAELLKSNIKCITEDVTECVQTVDLKNLEENLNYLPQTLKFFLENLFMGKDIKLKIAAIGQNIMQATWPRAINLFSKKNLQ